MFGLTWARARFSLVTFAAAMLAMFLAMSIDLQRPYWAVMTVYIVSQPMAAAVRSKAFQRLLGTVLGASAAVLMVPNLVNTPALLCLAMALWVGACLAISVLDRSPRSYIMMLAGYTAAIIGFSSVNEPGDIFELAVARGEEIVIGIACATLIHGLLFPLPFGAALRTRIHGWLGDADRWAVDILDSADPAALGRDRVRLAAAASELHMMSTHLPFDTSSLRETVGVVRAVHDRIVLLLPILSSLSDRLAVLRARDAALDEGTCALLLRVRTWIGRLAGAAGDVEAERAAIAAAMAAVPAGGDWHALNRLALYTRLQDLLTSLDELRRLRAQLDAPDAAVPPALAAIIATAAARPLHSDPGLALRSGGAVVLAILIACTVWIGMGWAEGGASAMLAAILCCLFATMDDPAPNIKVFGIALLIATPLAATYSFVVFPAIDSFPMLVMALAPTMLVLGVMLLQPATALLSLITLLNLCNSMAIQERFSTDFAAFLNVNLSQFFGLLTAIFVTRSFRSMSADASARRLLRHTWKSLAQMAQGRSDEAPAAFAARLVDRVGLLAPRLAIAEDRDLVGLDALRELRVGMDLVALQGLRAGLPAAHEAVLAQLLAALGTHYTARSAGTAADDEHLLPILDLALTRFSSQFSADGARALTALVGLRRNLFPRAPACLTGAA